MPEIIESVLGVLAAIAGFAIILYLAYLTTKFAGKRYAKGTGGGENLRLIESLPLGQDKYLMLAKAGDRLLLLGVTGQRIELISELDEESLKPEKEAAQPLSFKEILINNLSFGKNPVQQENPKEASSDEKQIEKE